MNPNVQAMQEDPEFSQLLAESEGYFEDAQSFYRYDPPDGETICVLTNVKTGKTTDKQLKKEVIQVRVEVTIQQPEGFI